MPVFGKDSKLNTYFVTNNRSFLYCYQLKNGTEPVKDFLDSLDDKMRAKMLRAIKLLKENGNTLRDPDSKNISNGIFELRAKIGTNISRVLYFFFVGNKAVLTNGFIKKSQKTPIKEIEKAQKYKDDFLNRYGDING